MILEFIEKNRLGPNPAQGLAGNRMQLLDAFLTQLETLRARLLHQFLEVPNATRPPV